MSNNPTTSNQWWRHMLNHKHFVMRPSSWQLQLAWQHFILQTNGKCKGSENYKFSVHVVAKTLSWAGGSQSYFAGCKRNNSWKPHCSSDVSVPECVLQQTDLAVQRKNCDRDASMECDTKALPSKNPSSKLLFNLNTLRTTSHGYQFCLSNWFPLLSRTDRPANVLSRVKEWRQNPVGAPPFVTLERFKLEANTRQLGIILSIFEIWQFWFFEATVLELYMRQSNGSWAMKKLKTCNLWNPMTLQEQALSLDDVVHRSILILQLVNLPMRSKGNFIILGGSGPAINQGHGSPCTSSFSWPQRSKPKRSFDSMAIDIQDIWQTARQYDSR